MQPHRMSGPSGKARTALLNQPTIRFTPWNTQILIGKCALTPGGRHFVGCWTLRVKMTRFKEIGKPLQKQLAKKKSRRHLVDGSLFIPISNSDKHRDPLHHLKR
jgi:hypothetical protein